MKQLLFFFPLVIFSNTKSINKRNTYGDEQVTPAGGGAPTAYVPPEQAPASVKQSSYVPECAPAPAPAQPSGYRAKRNTYGDEQVTPAGGGATPAAYVPPEQAPASVKQSSYVAECAPAPAPAQPSGYRAKRNTYGDEQVTPAGEGATPAAYVPPEQAPASVKQSSYVPECAPAPAPAQPSGYRAKRNTYGDEQVTPAGGGATPAAYVPPEQAPASVKQSSYVPECAQAPAPAQPSGYRAKRNTYGDEQVTPAGEDTEPAAYAPEQTAEVVEQPVSASYSAPVLPPAQPSGY